MSKTVEELLAEWEVASAAAAVAAEAWDAADAAVFAAAAAFAAEYKKTETWAAYRDAAKKKLQL